MDYKIGFVVLHYQNIDISRKCIEYLMKLDGFNKTNIVIVDNASPNNSGEELKRIYTDYDNIYVLRCESNLGFAKGNNAGYSFAKNQLKADIIVVMNNDVLISQNNFITEINRMNKDSNLHVIAPDIVNLVGFHQNPFRKKAISNKKMKYMYYYNSTLNILYRIPVINIVLSKLLQYKYKHKKFVNNKESVALYNIVPHGSCIIYLSSWINKEEIAFLPDTFMYFEEDILFEYISQKNYSIKYCPELNVKHIEDASVNASTKSELKKRLFIAKNLSKSIKKLILMRDNKSDN